jgi:hypothetical protein
MGDGPNLTPKLKRELSRLAPTSGSGPLFRAIEQAALAAQAAVPLGVVPELPAFEAVVERVEAAIERVLTAPMTVWPSHAARAGTIRHMDAERCAMFEAIKANKREPRHSFPEPDDTPTTAANIAVAGFHNLARLYHDEPHEARRRVLCARFGSNELRNRIGAAFTTSSRRAMRLPPEMWAHIVRFLDAASARRFARCSRTMHALVAPCWRRLVIDTRTLNGAASLLHARRFRNTTHMAVRLDEPLAGGAFAQLGELVAAMHNERRGLALAVTRRLSINKEASAPPIAATELTLSVAREPRKKAGLFAQLPRLVALGGVQRLTLGVDISASMLPGDVLAQLTSLQTLSIDFGVLELVQHVALHLPRDLDELLIKDAWSRLESPLPTPVVNFVCRAHRIVCCSAADALVIIDAMATAGVLAVVVPRMQCIVRGKCEPVKCVDAAPPPEPPLTFPVATDVLVEAQQLFNLIEQTDDDAELHCDVWAKRFFTQLTADELQPALLNFELDE